MKKIFNDIALGFVSAIIGGVILYALHLFNFVPDLFYKYFLKGVIIGLPLLLFMSPFVIRIYREHQIMRRSNALIIKVHAGHWAHLSALINNYIGLNKLTGTQDLATLKSLLEKNYYEKYRQQLEKDLQSIFPKKTKPQIEKIVSEITQTQNEYY